VSFDLLFMVLSFVSRKGFLPACGQDYANGNEPLLTAVRRPPGVLEQNPRFWIARAVAVNVEAPQTIIRETN
jgi:hypothetical protein